MPRKFTENENKLMKLTYASDFDKVLDDLFINEEEKKVFKMYYGENKYYVEISMTLNIEIRKVGDIIKKIAEKLANYDFDKFYD